jgi:hypothetical protein
VGEESNGGVNMIKLQYIHALKYHNETSHFVQLICAKIFNKKVLKKET